MKNSRMTWVVGAIGVAALAVAAMGGCGSAGKGNSKPAGEPGEPVVFQVSGMHCDGCAAAIANSLKKLPGVQSAKVSFDDKRAVVVPTTGQFDPDSVLSAVKELGYEASVAAASPQQTQ